ncbi:MAG: GGDEF domain-containing protein [Hyphomicrobium sp.]|uniref:GGDEF domain-containing protein n=1 Tax=Hyphomicrobium sp. TaxID=82 RepID=UPI00132941B6|nr:GGDEF domain-containing protein [Hyphomicrobium sp.]KAB2943205.1 MAG: GGDEF domain-containing protein [Hyphomicrobium sp.]MBZ0210154.1 GGDEF domain-containing protein [Hyphomicrobium sp.]
MAIRNSVLRSIAAHPWTSAQDAILGTSVLAVAGLLAIEFDLFYFAHELTTAERRVSLAEAIALTVLLGFCIGFFIYRRVREHRDDAQRRAEIDREMQELRDQALRDPLTDLPNRRAVLARLNDLQLRLDGRQHAFFLLDLNEFKRVNDQYGHAAGDCVLQVVAERFRRVARPADLLARLGGDEFAILAYDVDRSGAAAVGNRFLGTLENKIWVDGVGHDIGVSVGAVLIPNDGVTVPEILANADIAMYQAKDTDRSALVFFSDVKVSAGLYPRAAG